MISARGLSLPHRPGYIARHIQEGHRLRLTRRLTTSDRVLANDTAAHAEWLRNPNEKTLRATLLDVLQRLEEGE